MKQFSLACVVCSLVVSSGARVLSVGKSIRQVDRPMTIYGEGLKSCGAWVKTIGSDDAMTRVNRIGMSAWMRGFITSAGLYADNLKKTDGQAIEVFTDQYCTQNPIEPLSHVAMALAYELTEQK